MEFDTIKKFDGETFDRLKLRLMDCMVARRELAKNPAYATDCPTEIGLQLTHRCNMRCKMCYEWNDSGFFKKEKKKDELDISLIARLLEDTRQAKTRFYLWGGEPLLYSGWEAMAEMMATASREIILCTNGTKIKEKIDSLNHLSPHLTLLVSVDGLYDVHDNLRGKHAFSTLYEQLLFVLGEQEKGRFAGRISINAVLNDELIPHLYDFLDFFDRLNIDSVYLNYPWYISPSRAQAMDDYFLGHARYFDQTGFQPGTASWYAYSYQLSPQSETLLKKQIEKIKTRKWNIRARFQQHLANEEIGSFLDDTYVNPKRCLALSTRFEVMADGRAGTCCKFFPELAVGNLYQQSLREIWQGEAYNRRRLLLSEGNMPLCSKCVLLYRNNI